MTDQDKYSDLSKALRENLMKRKAQKKATLSEAVKKSEEKQKTATPSGTLDDLEKKD